MARTLSTHKGSFHVCRLGTRSIQGSELRPGFVRAISSRSLITQGFSYCPALTPPALPSLSTPLPRLSAAPPSAPPSSLLLSSWVVHPDPRGFPVPQDATHTPPRQMSLSSPHPQSAACLLFRCPQT